MSILSRLLRRKPAAPAPDLNWKVWEYSGHRRGWEVIAAGLGPVEAMELAILADKMCPERHHRVSCRPQ